MGLNLIQSSFLLFFIFLIELYFSLSPQSFSRLLLLPRLFSQALASQPDFGINELVLSLLFSFHCPCFPTPLGGTALLVYHTTHPLSSGFFKKIKKIFTALNSQGFRGFWLNFKQIERKFFAAPISLNGTLQRANTNICGAYRRGINAIDTYRFLFKILFLFFQRHHLLQRLGNYYNTVVEICQHTNIAIPKAIKSPCNAFDTA